MARWIIVISLLVYSYVFQGVGHNPLTHFGTMRSWVERGTAELGPLGTSTDDVVRDGDRSGDRIGDHIYANKAPGFALISRRTHLL